MGLPNFETQLALKEVCSASNALAAQEKFEENIELLNEWQVVFGEMSDVNALRLMNTTRRLGILASPHLFSGARCYGSLTPHLSSRAIQGQCHFKWELRCSWKRTQPHACERWPTRILQL
jgi:hypothetical protein